MHPGLLAFVVAAAAIGGQTAAQPPATRPALTVVCFGDSITGHRPDEPYRDKYLKYADLLELLIEGRCGPQSVRVFARGFAGDKTYPDPPRTPGAATRIRRDILSEAPDVAVILIGGNDRKNTPEDRDRTREHLRLIVQSCLDNKVRVLLVQYAVLVNPDNPDKAWTHLVKNNDLIAEVARELDVPTVALQPAFDDALKTTPLAQLVNLVDGVHLAPGGEIVVARTLFYRLVELGWLPPRR